MVNSIYYTKAAPFVIGKSTSEEIKAALIDYLVCGINNTNAATLNLPKSNLIRVLKRLEVVVRKADKLKEVDWSCRLD